MADLTNQLRVRFVTPERTLFEREAASVELPSKTGYFEVLYGHAPLVAELGAGDVIVHGSANTESGAASSALPAGDLRYNVSWGFVEVLGDRVTILASDALKPEEIDVKRAQEQLARGNKQWSEAGESADAYAEALRVISEAEAKLASASEKH
jgi:F-type H+-transporting ATPase subunit epsilon